jgi:hypothetical protein
VSGPPTAQAFEALGPVFAKRGWVFFGPYRRGQGLSAAAGPYIGDQIAAAEKQGGLAVGAATMVRLLETDHLTDQLEALASLRTQSFVEPQRIAVAETRSAVSKPCSAQKKPRTARRSIPREPPKAGQMRRKFDR